MAGRRQFLKTITALGAAGLAGPASGARVPYDPAAKFSLEITDVPFRRTEAGRPLLARVYQPQAAGPFPVLLDLHGGGWYRKDRFANEPMDRATAASGTVVVVGGLAVSNERPGPG